MKHNILSVIESKPFKDDLAEYVEYAAHIKLEKFIAYSFQKEFKKRGIDSVLEQKKTDIVAKNKKIELKYHFDVDIIKRFQPEVKKGKGSDTG